MPRIVPRGVGTEIEAGSSTGECHRVLVYPSDRAAQRGDRERPFGGPGGDVIDQLVEGLGANIVRVLTLDE